MEQCSCSCGRLVLAKQALAVLAFLCVSFAFAKDKTSIPKQIVVAKYVLVTTYFGDNLADSRVPQVDRQAANDVMDAIQGATRLSTSAKLRISSSSCEKAVGRKRAKGSISTPAPVCRSPRSVPSLKLMVAILPT